MFSQQPLISQYCSTHTLDCQWTVVSTAKIDSVTGIFVKTKNPRVCYLPETAATKVCHNLSVLRVVWICRYHPLSRETLKCAATRKQTAGTVWSVSQHQQANTSYRSWGETYLPS